MPELPEVETIASELREPLIGQTFEGADTDWPNQIAKPSVKELQRRISGRTIEAISRRGKYLVFSLDQNETLIIHLKMTGQLSITSQDGPVDKYVHTRFLLAGGKELRFRDVRKFGRVYLVRDPAEVLAKLGIEPLSPPFTAQWLYKRLTARNRLLKPLLLDQTFIAGIGNIYADEALHYARLSPIRRSNSVSRTESDELHAAIQAVLRRGVDRKGASIDSYRKPDGGVGEMQNALKVYGRSGEPCYRCGAIIERTITGGRSTHYCPSCQR